MKNLFYISNFNNIGGVETFIYELAKKYSKRDITVVYKTGSLEQIKRLKKYVRVIQYSGQHFKCDKAFFNYDTDIINNIEAKEYIQIIHACFKSGQISPHKCDKINKYLCVSKAAGKEWEELTGNKSKLCKNPLTKPDKEKPIVLVSATRLTKEKGKSRILKLLNLLDEAKINFVWYIFTNDKNEIQHKNLVWLPPILDFRRILSTFKNVYGVQLSDTEGDCYFTRECESLGIPLLVTPCPSFTEQGLKDGENCYYIPFEVDGFDVEKIKTIPKYKAFIQEDNWGKVLAPGNSTYQEDLKTEVELIATKAFQNAETGQLYAEGEKFKVNKIRAEEILERKVATYAQET